MTVPTPVPPIPSDPGLPGARGLFEAEGIGAVRAYLDERGWAADQVAAVQATYRPARQCLVRFRARATNGAGERRTFSICVETRARFREMAAAPEELGQRFGLREPAGRYGPYLAWAFPYDPNLPGSADAAWGPAVRDLLADGGPRPEAVSVQPIRYRPRRRAVYRYRALHRGRRGRRWDTWFGKVLTSDKAARAHHLRASVSHPRLAVPSVAAGPTLAFRPLEGRSLRDLLLRGSSLPAPDRVAALPANLRQWVGEAAPSWDRTTHRAVARSTFRHLSTLLPAARDDLARVLEAVEAGEERDPRSERVVHGDLYEAQVFVDDDFSLGLVDLDDLGPGDPAMDAGNFCAHLLVLALAVPSAAGRLVAYRQLVRSAFLTRLDLSPADLAWREALAMLLLATGPFRVLDPRWPEQVRRRIEVAVRLIEEANA
jgi:Phosphotransferase enzyme family